MILAYLLLITGLTISAVAIYYSVVGLTAIFSAAVIPIIIMGSALEVGKLVCASWLKENWNKAPRFMKYYMITAVMVLMLITSMGIFGFLSKAHNDQNLVSGDVQSKIAIYDEKIKTEKENIEANRKALKQMDATIDETIARSKTDQGAANANAMRQRQAKERTQIQADIAKSQKSIAALNEERAPIAAEVRKVEAEVGPIKYIAKFIYGEHGADENMLEKAVTWIIILIVVVFDPLAVIMLLAAQMTFGWKREEKENTQIADQAKELPEASNVPQPAYEPDNGPLTEPQIEQIKETVKKEPFIPYTIGEEDHEPDYPEPKVVTADSTQPVVEEDDSELSRWNKMIEEAEKEVLAQQSTVEERVAKGETYIDNQGQEIALEEAEVVDPQVAVETEESKKKTYMIKDNLGQIQIKNRDT
jgi:hypothetical protein